MEEGEDTVSPALAAACAGPSGGREDRRRPELMQVAERQRVLMRRKSERGQNAWGLEDRVKDLSVCPQRLHSQEKI